MFRHDGSIRGQNQVAMALIPLLGNQGRALEMQKRRNLLLGNCPRVVESG